MVPANVNPFLCPGSKLAGRVRVFEQDPAPERVQTGDVGIFAIDGAMWGGWRDGVRGSVEDVYGRVKHDRPELVQDPRLKCECSHAL